MWSKKPYTGCNDIMHISFLQITTGIFPEESDHNISRKYLSVMGSLKIVDSAVKNLTADNNMGDIKLTNCESDVLNLSVDMGSLKISGFWKYD